MNNLPGYDAWLTHDPRDRGYAPCVCGHELDDHDEKGCGFCICKEYEEKDYEDDRD